VGLITGRAIPRLEIWAFGWKDKYIIAYHYIAMPGISARGTKQKSVFKTGRKKHFLRKAFFNHSSACFTLHGNAHIHLCETPEHHPYSVIAALPLNLTTSMPKNFFLTEPPEDVYITAGTFGTTLSHQEWESCKDKQLLGVLNPQSQERGPPDAPLPLGRKVLGSKDKQLLRVSNPESQERGPPDAPLPLGRCVQQRTLHVRD
jgi:hypothetical protein